MTKDTNNQIYGIINNDIDNNSGKKAKKKVIFAESEQIKEYNIKKSPIKPKKSKKSNAMQPAKPIIKPNKIKNTISNQYIKQDIEILVEDSVIDSQNISDGEKELPPLFVLAEMNKRALEKTSVNYQDSDEESYYSAVSELESEEDNRENSTYLAPLEIEPYYPIFPGTTPAAEIMIMQPQLNSLNEDSYTVDNNKDISLYLKCHDIESLHEYSEIDEEEHLYEEIAQQNNIGIYEDCDNELYGEIEAEDHIYENLRKIEQNPLLTIDEGIVSLDLNAREAKFLRNQNKVENKPVIRKEDHVAIYPKSGKAVFTEKATSDYPGMTSKKEKSTFGKIMFSISKMPSKILKNIKCLDTNVRINL